MKALQAIYNKGQIDFLFTFPETSGPVNILVIFPDDEPSKEKENPFIWGDWPNEEDPFSESE